MQRLSLSFITLFILIHISGCSTKTVKTWTDFIPENTTFVLVADEGTKISDITDKKYFTYLDDLTPAPIQQLSSLNSDFPSSLQLTAIALSPATSTESHFLWISKFDHQNFDELAARYYEPFSQNNYFFYGYKIHRLIINKSDLYAAKLGKWLIISKSSVVVENALRTSLGLLNAMEFSGNPAAGSVVLNTPALNNWVEQFASIKSRPSILNMFAGTRPIQLEFSTSEDSLDNIQITGQLNTEPSKHSALTDALTFENRPIRLDRHIGSNAAAFAILRLPPAQVPVQPDENQASFLDSLLMEDMDLYQQMAAALDDEFAFVAFPESGLSTTGEYLFLRNLKNKAEFTQILDQLAEEEMMIKVQSSYHINSSVLSELIGSELSTFRDFYLSFSGNVVVIGKRRGLVESVNADRMRRRVIYYDETYANIRREMQDDLSGFVWFSSTEFLKFIQPYLKPENLAGSIIGRFDITAITMEKQGDTVELAINTYSREGSMQPYEELWVMPLSNANLTAAPVLGNLVGGSTNEIVISTEDGMVYVLAADGTVTAQASTNGLKPVGGPILYDWYGNGQLVIMLPAGNKIFAWNSNGDLLPKFPLELASNITSPILVEDILRNGVPEIVVATEDRKVHVIDGRGENIKGWPQNTNATVNSKPVFNLFEDHWSVWAFSENALHSWLRNGNPRPEFPQFINAQFTDSPLFDEDQILGSAADGYLYSIGRNPFFSDTTTAISDTLNEIKVNMLYVAEGELTAVSVSDDILLRNEDGFYREDLLVTQSVNGSVFMYNKNGELRFTQSLGQPASPTFTPQILDVDGNKNMDLVALADFGRLYAWEILTNERLYNIPTSGMRYPLFTDLNGDGQLELIAQTREGLRTWTINITD